MLCVRKPLAYVLSAKACSFKVDSAFMKMFYSCCIESVITFSLRVT